MILRRKLSMMSFHPAFVGVACLIYMIAGALLPASLPRALILLTGAGFGLLPLLKRKWPLSEALFAVPVLGTAALSAAALVSWLTQSAEATRWGLIALVGGTTAYTVFCRHRFILRAAPFDTIALLTALILTVPALFVYVINGPAHLTGGTFEARGWIGHDSFYFMALAQQSIDRLSYPAEAPFMAGAPNYYAAYFHCGAGALSYEAGILAPFSTWLLFPVIIFAGLGLACHVVRRLLPRPDSTRTGFVSAAIIATLFLLTPDKFVFLQTHIFGFGTLMLSWLFLKPMWRGNLRSIAVCTVIALMLCAGHGVHAAAAILMLVATTAIAFIQKHNASARFGLAGVFVSVIFFQMFNRSHNTSPLQFDLSTPEVLGYVQYFVAPFFLPAAFVFLPLFRRANWLNPGVWCGLLLAGATAFYSVVSLLRADKMEEFFGIYNAPRFLLIAFVVAVPLAFAWRKRLTLALLLTLVLQSLLLPTETSFESVRMFSNEPYTVAAPVVKNLQNLRDRYPLNTRTITNMHGFGVPTFSGFPDFGNESSLFYALGSVTPAEFALRLKVRQAMIQRKNPAQTLSDLKSYGIDLIILRRTPAPSGQGANPADLDLLPPGTYKVVQEFPLGVIEILP